MFKTAEEVRAANREACRRYREKNRDAINEKQRQRVASNPEKYKAITRKSMKKAYAENPEKYKVRSNEWRKTNYQIRPELFHGWRVKHEAKVRSTSWANQWLIGEIYDLARKRSLATGMQWEVDHIVPVDSSLVCGLHVEQNLRIVPMGVNRSKGNMFWPDHPDPLNHIEVPIHYF